MIYFRHLVSLPEASFHCALAGRAMAFLKIFGIISAFSPAKQL